MSVTFISLPHIYLFVGSFWKWKAKNATYSIQIIYPIFLLQKTNSERKCFTCIMNNSCNSI